MRTTRTYDALSWRTVIVPMAAPHPDGGTDTVWRWRIESGGMILLEGRTWYGTPHAAAREAGARIATDLAGIYAALEGGGP